MPPFTSPAVTARLSPLLVSHHAQRILVSQHQQLTLSRHAVFSRPSSMSAIVRGLRRTFRDPDGKRPPGYNPEVAAHVRQRRQEREAADMPTYKLFRGKKDITERPVAKAKTRRARFFDPEDEYGKKSLVYQAKTGKLEAEVKALARQRGDQEYKQEERPYRRDGGGRNVRSGRDGRDGRNNRDSDYEPRSRTARTGGSSFGGRDGPRSRQGAAGPRDYRVSDREGYQGGGREPRQPYNRERAPERRSDTRSEGRFGREQRRDYDEERDTERDTDRDDGRDNDRGSRDGRDSRPREAPSSAPVPLSIPYTTAASQFLYGRSVVEAALRSARRQLYKLYVYGGANRSTGGAAQDQHAGRTIEHLAQRRGLNVQIVDERWQRLLDKMSKGRPHNGYVLEASPLPQPPLTALGKYTDGTTSTTGASASPFTKGAGFQVEVGYQSREEADVNGTAPFVTVDPATARHHRPLVLLLDQVLDPGNLGAILRSASFLGVSAVVVSKHSSATLTSVALKASAGAAEALALFSVETPATFLAQSRRAGWKVYAAVPPPEGYVPGSPKSNGHFTSTKKPVLDLDGLEAADPLQKEAIILVMGSEGEGLPRVIRREADAEVSIANRSGSKVVDSLNVSVATGLLCASFLKGATRGVASNAGDEAAAVEAELEAETGPEEAATEEKREETKARDELGIF